MVAPEPESTTSADLRAAASVSLQSLVWTVIGSSAAVAVGLLSRSGALVAFGAIGLVDAVGSAALVYHFRHALRHATISVRLERLAHGVVVVGLIAVGAATMAVDAVRLGAGATADASVVGSALAAVSVFVLAAFSIRKQAIARRVSSAALRADGHLSAVGASLAAIALVGTATAQWFGWHWADPIAAILVGGVAMVLGLLSARDGRRAHARTLSEQNSAHAASRLGR